MINFIRTITKGYILGLLLITIAGIIIGCTARAETKTSKPTNSPKPAEVAVTRDLPENRMYSNPYSEMPYDDDMEYSAPMPKQTSQAISKAVFQKIKVGMMLTEVEKLTGETGMLVSSMEVNGRQTKIYKWSNADYSRYIDVTIENGKVIEKKDKGLK